MYRSNSYGYEDQEASSLLPFIMGVMVGVGASALYAAGRTNRLGYGVGNAIHTVEEKAVQAKDTIVERAGSIKDSVANRISGQSRAENTWDAANTAAVNIGETVEDEARRVSNAAFE